VVLSPVPAEAEGFVPPSCFPGAWTRREIEDSGAPGSPDGQGPAGTPQGQFCTVHEGHSCQVLGEEGELSMVL
jgi:hypothetical protein